MSKKQKAKSKTKKEAQKMRLLVVILGVKGGLLKSTLARLLTVCGVKDGIDVILADLDYQQLTSVDWARDRDDLDQEPTVKAMAFQMASDVVRAAKDRDLTVVDCPGRGTKGYIELAKAADLVIHPTGPTKDDLKPAIRVFNSLVKSGVSEDKLWFCVTKTDSMAQIDIAKEYIEEAGYQAFEGVIPYRRAYANVHDEGRCIAETQFQSLNRKAMTLVEEVIGKLG